MSSLPGATVALSLLSCPVPTWFPSVVQRPSEHAALSLVQTWSAHSGCSVVVSSSTSPPSTVHQGSDHELRLWRKSLRVHSESRPPPNIVLIPLAVTAVCEEWSVARGPCLLC